MTAGDDDELVQLLDEQAHADAVRARRAVRDAVDRSRQLATWNGTLRDLAEQGSLVVVTTLAATTHRGVVRTVGADHVVLGGDGSLTAVATATIVGLRVAPGGPTPERPADGGRPPPATTTLLDVLDRWRDDAATCQVVTVDGGTERGRFVTVGEDVASLRGSAGTVHLRTAAVAAVTVRPG